jgi:hypothetical protein
MSIGVALLMLAVVLVVLVLAALGLALALGHMPRPPKSARVAFRMVPSLWRVKLVFRAACTVLQNNIDTSTRVAH